MHLLNVLTESCRYGEQILRKDGEECLLLRAWILILLLLFLFDHDPLLSNHV